MASKIRWGVLSTARIGYKVIPAIYAAPNCEVAAVASRSLDKAQAFASDLNIPKAYGSYEELLATPDIDAIYISLPNSEHGAWSIKCAEAGKHTLCEKPLASNAAEAQQLVDVFNARNLKLAEAFMYRHHPQTKRVQAIVKSGALGEIKLIRAAFTFRIGNAGDIRLSNNLAGGGLMDVGCYCVSLIRLIAGEPLKASAFANFGVDSGVDEILAGVVHCPNGVIAHFDCGLRAFHESSYEIRGTHGRLVLQKAFNPTPKESTTIQWWEEKDGHEEYHAEEIPPTNHYTLMAQEFAEALLNDHPLAYPAEDAVANMRVIDMLLASARSAV